MLVTGKQTRVSLYRILKIENDTRSPKIEIPDAERQCLIMVGLYSIQK